MLTKSHINSILNKNKFILHPQAPFFKELPQNEQQTQGNIFVR